MEIKKIFLGNLDFNTTEDELKNLLSSYGTVVAIKINKKKGYAFAEMGNAEEASKTVQGLNGQKHRDREIRASLEMKASKAKALSIKKYKERGWDLSKAKFGRAADARNSGEESLDYPQSESNERESSPRSSFYPRPQKKAWASKKPSYSGKPARDGEKSSPRGAPKKAWSSKKPSYSGKPARDGEKSSPWGAPKKAWSSKKPSGSSGNASRSWGEKPGKSESSGDKSYSKPWSAKGPQKRFFKSPTTKSGGSRNKSSSGSIKPKPHRGSGNRDRS